MDTMLRQPFSGLKIKDMPRLAKPPVRLSVSAILILTMLTTVAAAEAGDPSLQGRVFQRTDGSIYVYKDGSRFAIELAPLSGDDIDAIPLSGPVDRVDSLFVQATPSTAPSLDLRHYAARCCVWWGTGVGSWRRRA
jgi:hypothetical protein